MKNQHEFTIFNKFSSIINSVFSKLVVTVPTRMVTTLTKIKRNVTLSLVNTNYVSSFLLYKSTTKWIISSHLRYYWSGSNCNKTNMKLDSSLLRTFYTHLLRFIFKQQLNGFILWNIAFRGKVEPTK